MLTVKLSHIMLTTTTTYVTDIAEPQPKLERNMLR